MYITFLSRALVQIWNDRPTPCKFWRNRALTCPKGVAIAVCAASLIPYLEYSVESSTSSPDADIVFTDFFASVRLFFSIQSESKKGVPKAKSHDQNTHSVLLVCSPHSSSSFSRLFSKQIVCCLQNLEEKTREKANELNSKLWCLLILKVMITWKSWKTFFKALDTCIQ